MTPPVHNTSLDLDRSSFEVLAGLNWTLLWYPIVWQAGLMEDLNHTNRTADFAVFSAWSVFFRPPCRQISVTEGVSP